MAMGVGVGRRRRTSLLLFQELYDVVAYLLESLHHHEMPSSFYHHQPPVADPLGNTTAADTLGASVHR